MSLYDIKKIYVQKNALNPRAKEILFKHRGAEIINVPSHWNIEELHSNEENVEHWAKIKRNILVIGSKKSLECRENGRSTDYIAPGASNGCTMACSYCYVARRKGYANPVTVFTNIQEIMYVIKKHAVTLPKKVANQTDSTYWTYDIGENSDCSADDYLSSNVKDLISMFTTMPNAKGSFATKHVNRNLLKYNPKLKTRIRFSLMPQSISKVLDVRTSSISDRIKAIDDFVTAGYEVHINLSPVVVYDGWLKDYQDLFIELNDSISQKSKEQLKSEVIFLTHNEELHQINKKWHPTSEQLIYRPDIQETKVSLNGQLNLRYGYNHKPGFIQQFKELYKKHLPYADIRYIF